MNREYAGFARRAGAWVIDAALLSVIICVVTLMLTVGVSVMQRTHGGSGSVGPIIRIILPVVALVVGWLYSALLESSVRQATVGKRALGITVTDRCGGRPGFGRATIRFFCKLISTLILFIGYIIAPFTERKQALHDLISGCIVTRKLPAADGPVDPDRALAYPDIRQAARLLALLFLYMSLFAVVVLLLCRLLGLSVTDNPAATLAPVNLLAFALVLKIGLRRTGRRFSVVCPLSAPPAALYAPLALVLLGAAIVLSEADNALRSVLPMPEPILEAFRALAGAKGSVWATVLAVVVVAPLTEECLFRGLILRGFLLRYSVRKAIVVSSLLFALIHVMPWQIPGAFVFGAIFAWLYIRTGSILPCILGHAFVNAIPSIVQHILGIEVQGLSGGASGTVQFQPLWLDLAGILLLAGGLFLLKRALAGPHRVKIAGQGRSDDGARNHLSEIPTPESDSHTGPTRPGEAR